LGVSRHTGVALGLSCLILVSVGRVADTWNVYTATYDEPLHVAAGMAWLDRGIYPYDQKHPPLARVADALALYLDGYHSERHQDIQVEGNAILNQRAAPRRAIALARAGVLPFLVLAILVVFVWARALGGDMAGLVAVVAFTAVPPVLAHSGLATNDAAAMATTALGLFALVRWLEHPSRAMTIGLGAAVGLAVLVKMSALVFLPAAVTAIVAYWLTGNSRSPSQYARRAAAAALIACFTVWGGYRFSTGPVHTVAARLPMPVRSLCCPAPEFARGLIQLRQTNAHSRRSYLLGRASFGGRWEFFPVALAVKTPLPFLLLAGLGGIALARLSRSDRLAAAPVIAAAAVLVTAMPANLNIGLRHILPIYPMLGVCAGVGIDSLWKGRDRRPIKRLLAGGLTGWLVLESIAAHPDYLTYFNQLAGRHPEQVLVDSDLDWGQDLGRMVDTLRARKIEHVWITYHGTVDLSTQGLPPFTVLKPDTVVTGWIAASIYKIQLGEHGGDLSGFAWLRRYTPVARAGHSMLLYHIDPPSDSRRPR
jgi:Dolichyl-phosphate-mannose-protein mannosyltransferase